MSIVIDYTKGFFEPSPAGETVGDISGNATLDLSSGNVFSYTPAADTTFVFNNPPASGTAYGMTLKVTGAEITSGYDLANASYDSISFSVAGQDGSPFGLAFNNDGTKMYLLGSTNDSVFQYTLSTAFDLSTASYDSVSFSVAAQDGSLVGIEFSSDGTKMFIVGSGNDSVYQYTLSTAFDLSTASYDSVSLSVTTEDAVPFGLEFNNDGTKMYILGASNDTVFQYTLSTAWSLSTASYDSVSFSVAAQDTIPTDIVFNSDGTKMFMVGLINDTVYQYSLSTAFDISTAVYDSISFSLATQDGNPRGLLFNNDGTKMYMSGDANTTLYQYTTGSTSTATISYPASVDWPSGTAPDAPAAGETDVLVFYTEDGGTTYQGFQAGDAMA